MRKQQRGDKGQTQAGDRGLSTEERTWHRGTRDSDGDKVAKLSSLESEAGFAGTAADREPGNACGNIPGGKKGSEGRFEVQKKPQKQLQQEEPEGKSPKSGIPARTLPQVVRWKIQSCLFPPCLSFPHSYAEDATPIPSTLMGWVPAPPVAGGWDGAAFNLLSTPNHPRVSITINTTNIDNPRDRWTTTESGSRRGRKTSEDLKNSARRLKQPLPPL